MDFSLSSLPKSFGSGTEREAAVLACKSKEYFLEKLEKIGIKPLILTTGLMAPEAYTLDALIRSWAGGDKPFQVRDKAAAAYHKYQKCGLEAAKRLFYTKR
jgi:hypothetical protein